MGSTSENQSDFASFMKAYESRKDAGVEGPELLAGSSEVSPSTALSDFASLFNFNQTATEQGEVGKSLTKIMDDASSFFGISKKNSGDENGDLESGAVSGSVDNAWSELSRTQRFKGFVAMLCLSGFFFLLSSFFFPTVLLFPQKFIFSFTLGSLFFMGAFALVQGPSDFVRNLFSKERLPFTAAYFGSIIGTFYSCLVMRRYIAIVLFSWVQVISLGWYAATYLPGGRIGINLIYRFLNSFLRNGFVPCMKMIVGCFQKLFD